MEQTRTAAPDRLIEALKQTQTQITQMQAAQDAAIFGARCALGVPDDWQWDGAGWTAPETPADPTTPEAAPY
jgi:hypothetical protein